MNIKKKIGVWCLLCALMVALVPTCSTKASEDKTYFEYSGIQYQYDSDIVSKISSGYDVLIFEQHHYGSYGIANREEFRILTFDGNLYDVGIVQNGNSYYLALFDKDTGEMANVPIQYYCMSLNLDGGSYYWPPTSQHLAGEGESVVVEVHYSVYTYAHQGYNYTITPKGILYSSADIYYCDYVDSSNLSNIDKYDVMYKNDAIYSFKKWCSDANLNCSASSNESDSVIPYSFNTYWHIVRKTNTGKWLLTTIGNSALEENLTDYTLMYSEGMEKLQVFNLYSGEDVNGYLLNIRQYEYDTDGWRLKSYVTEDVRETDDCIIDLGVGSGIDDARVMAFTSANIYDESFNLVTPASTEYTEPSVPEVTPEPTPGTGSDAEVTPSPTTAPTPTVIPAVGAGQATVTNDRTGVYEEPTTSSQLQHYLYNGALVYVVEVLDNDWYYIRYEVGGLSQTGYVCASNIEYDSENGVAPDMVGGDVVENVEEMLGMVRVVPVMISVLFSFLPPWCLAVVGVGFSLLIALIIYKCARG